MKLYTDNLIHIQQCPCCWQGIDERAFFDISDKSTLASEKDSHYT